MLQVVASGRDWQIIELQDDEGRPSSFLYNDTEGTIYVPATVDNYTGRFKRRSFQQLKAAQVIAFANRDYQTKADGFYEKRALIKLILMIFR